MSLPFTYALVDDDATVIRQFRWSAKEAKWHKEQGKNIIKLEVIKLKQTEKNSYDELSKLCGTATF
jgi:hypothetical protein